MYYIIEWGNGNTDCFSSRDEAIASYADHDQETRSWVSNGGYESNEIPDGATLSPTVGASIQVR